MPAITRIAGWKHKEGTTDEQKRANKEGLLRIYTELAHLVNHGPIGGKNVSNLGFDQGFDLVFTAEFKSEATRDEFNPHPIHDAYVKGMQEIIEDVFVYDLVKGDYGV
ncbi:hypothetical protein PENSPDRAFT_758265 [Peniophora sp. CONT]|nr:hypothetical protein PENSPDRAFT_758265 [Peniophora sp. CONT]